MYCLNNSLTHANSLPADQDACAGCNNMQTADDAYFELLEKLPPVSLDETNRKARMLSRVDNKYVLDFDQFTGLLKRTQGAYAALQINDLRQFSYASCYYDDALTCYFQHHQGRRQRFKVRTREYVDSGTRFFEIKLKALRGQTRKLRVGCDFLVQPQIDDQYLTMFNNACLEQYKQVIPIKLEPSLLVGYKRCTLVALEGEERVTIDYGLCFSDPASSAEPVRISNNFIIVETKSKDGKGMTDRALQDMQVRKAKKCSKYCIGVNLIGRRVKNNYFLPTIKLVSQNIIDRQSIANQQPTASHTVALQRTGT